MKKLIPIAVLALWPGAPVRAADLVVCPGGGAGCYADIQAAIDDAAPGDTVLVQPGVYGPFTVDLPIRVIGSGSGLVRVLYEPPGAGISVQGLPPGSEAVVAGMGVFPSAPGVDPLTASGCVRIANNKGTVVLNDVAATKAGPGPVYDFGPAAVVTKSVHVVLSSCTLSGADLDGGDGLRALSSTIALASTVVRGGSPGPAFGPHGGRGVYLGLGARFSAAHSQIFGGDGAISFGLGTAPNGGPAIEASLSGLILKAGKGSIVRGGQGGIDDPPFGPSVAGVGGHGLVLTSKSLATWPAGFTVVGGFDWASVDQAANVTTDATSKTKIAPTPFATLRTTDPVVEALALPFHLELFGEPGDVTTTFGFFDLAPPFGIAGVEGTIYVPFGDAVISQVEVLSSIGTATVPLHIPADAAWIGRAFYFQFLEAGKGPDRYSNPTLVTVPL